MDSDFKEWYLENATFIDRLHYKGSILFDKVKDIIDSLAYMINIDESEIDSDMENIFDIGYAYLYAYISELKIYSKNYFQDNFNDLLAYDKVINYIFYVNDLKELLVGNDLYHDEVREDLEYILNKGEEIVSKRLEVTDEILDDFENKVETLTMFEHRNNLITTPELFADVVDKLKI